MLFSIFRTKNANKIRIRNFFLFIVIFCILLANTFIMSLSVQGGDGTITVDTVKANCNDEVVINLSIKDNPGIMAITVSITYDVQALSYEKYYKGILKDYTICDHPDKGIVRFVTCEKKDNSANGNLISIQFKVKENATAGLHKVTVEYSSGDFCNWNERAIMPEIVPGGVDVAYNTVECEHKNYTEWEQIVPPTCEGEGLEQRVCKDCGHVESRVIPPIGHDYDDFWTIDVEATENSKGTMSRHCKRCDAVTDVKEFSLPDVTENDFSNKVGAVVEENGFTGVIKNDNSSVQSDENSSSNTNIESSAEKKHDNGKIKSNNTKLIVLSFILMILICLIILIVYKAKNRGGDK